MDEKETKTEEVTANVEEMAILKEYKKLQQNSVSKEKYEKDIQELKEKNSIYLKAITEGSDYDTTSDESINVIDAIEDISKFKGTNLEYWKKMTKTIDAVLRETPESEITPITSAEGLEEIIKVNETMKDLVNKSNNDPDYFRTLYKNRVTDSAPRISSEIEKHGGLVSYFEQKQK